MAGAHASKSPSKASMWMNCAKSLTANAGQVDLGDPSARNAGTALHHFRERALTDGVDPIDLVGSTVMVEGEEFELDEDQAASMQPGIDRVTAFGGELHVEVKVDLEPWLGPDQFGTCDTGVVTPDLIVIQDYKSGFDPVDVFENEQLQLYALGFWHTIARHRTKATEFMLMIDQPNNFRGGQSEWTVTLEELLAFGERAKAAAGVTDDLDAPGTPGPKTCRWCLAKAKCGELAKFNLDMVGLTEDDMEEFMNDMLGGCAPTLPKIDDLTPERRIFIINHAPMFEQWIEAMYAHTLNDALNGNPTPSKKAVIGRAGNRKWIDTEAVAEFVDSRFTRDEVYTTKLKSPAQMEKVMGKRNWPKLLPLIGRSDGKPILVDESDPRDSIAPLADKFDDLDTDEVAASTSENVIVVDDLI